jgi:hypothetical protein
MIANDQEASALPRLVIGGAEQRAGDDEGDRREESAEPNPTSGTVAARLIAGRIALWEHPQAVRAAVRALHAEGVRFARTPAGAAWLERLAGSDLARHGRFVWESYGMNAALGDDVGLLPSAWLDALVATSKDPRLEELLAAVVFQGVEDERVPLDGPPAPGPRTD